MQNILGIKSVWKSKLESSWKWMHERVQCYMQVLLVFKTKILNLEKSRDWSLLQKVRSKEHAVGSYSEMT